MSIACPGIVAMIDPGLCRAIDHYCERTSASFDSEPINALTNAAFLLSSWFAWLLAARCPATAERAVIHALSVIIAIVGIGSFTFHTLGTRWAEWLDVIPILVFMLTYLWLVLRRFFGWPVWSAALSVAVFFAATFALEAAVPGWFLWGGAMYLPAIVVMIVFGAFFHVRIGPAAGRAFSIAVGVFLLSYAARSLDSHLCAAMPTGTHFIWHIMNAILLYLLVRVAVLYGPKARPAAR